MHLFRLALVLVTAAALAPSAPASAQGLGVPRAVVPTICAGATAASAQVCLDDGDGQVLPWGRIDPAAHSFAPLGDASWLTLGMPDGSARPLPSITGRDLVAPLPDTIQAFDSVTTVAGSRAITLVWAAFKATDAGKLITIWGAGPNEGRLVTRIAAVADATHITVASPPTRAMSATTQRVTYGSDQYASLQGLATLARNLGVGMRIEPGIYMVSQGLTFLPPPNHNAFTLPASLPRLEAGATLMAGAPMQAVVTYGSTASDYSGYLRNFVITGGTVDANFVAADGVLVPFGLQGTRQNQDVMNALVAYVQYGSKAAPAATAGVQDENNSTTRDVEYIPVVSVTRTNPPVVTTAYDHPLSTGRVVAFTEVGGMTPLAEAWFRVTVTGPRTFTLDNANASSWPAFSGGRVSMTMPSMDVPTPVYRITNARPAVVSSNVHGFTDGELVDLYNVAVLPIDGTYCVKHPTAQSFQLYAQDCATPIDTTAGGTYRGNGIALPHRDGAIGPNGVYNANSTDFEIHGAKGYGVLYGIYNDPATSGYDGKYQFHWFDYVENGMLRAAVSAGGDNTIYAAQIDCPALWGFRLTGPRNLIVGSRMDCAGFVINPDDQASFVRLEAGADVFVDGGGAKGETGHRMLETVSGIGTLGSYGTIAGYYQIGFANTFVTHTQPDVPPSPGFWVRNLDGAAVIQARGTSGSGVYACDSRAGNVGAYLAAGAGSAAIATTDNACNYTATAARFTTAGVTIPHALAVQGNIVATGLGTTCSGAPSGTVIKDGSTRPATLRVCP